MLLQNLASSRLPRGSPSRRRVERLILLAAMLVGVVAGAGTAAQTSQIPYAQEPHSVDPYPGEQYPPVQYPPQPYPPQQYPPEAQPAHPAQHSDPYAAQVPAPWGAPVSAPARGSMREVFAGTLATVLHASGASLVAGL